MSGWRAFHPPRDAETLAGRIYAIVCHTEGGIGIPDLCARIGAGYAYTSVVARCHTMVQRGQLTKELRHKPGTKRLVAYFLPPKPENGAPPRKLVVPVASLVRQALERETEGTIATVAWAAGLSRKVTRDTLDRLVKGGEVTRIGAGNQQRFRLVDDEDEWEPKPFIHPIRARALGLTKAA